MKENIAEDIEMLASYWIRKEGFVSREAIPLIEASKRIEAYLATYKPDEIID